MEGVRGVEASSIMEEQSATVAPRAREENGDETASRCRACVAATFVVSLNRRGAFMESLGLERVIFDDRTDAAESEEIAFQD